MRLKLRRLLTKRVIQIFCIALFLITLLIFPILNFLGQKSNNQVLAYIVSDNYSNQDDISDLKDFEIRSGRGYIKRDRDWYYTTDFSTQNNGESPVGWTTTSSNYQIQSNELKHITSAYDNATATVDDMSLADGYIEADIRVDGGEQFGGVVFRYQDSQNYYVASFSSLYDTLKIDRVVSGTFTNLANYSISLSNGTFYTLKVEFTGNQFDVFLDSTEYISDATDSTYSSGKVGVWRNGTVVQFDDFTAQEWGYFEGYTSSTLPTGWTEEASDWGIDNTTDPNSLENPTNNYDNSKAYISGKSFRDGEILADVKARGGETMAGIAFRVQDNQNYYEAHIAELYDTVVLSKVEGGSYTTLTSVSVSNGTFPLSQFHSFKIVIQGPQIEVWVNSTKYLEYTDSTYLSGKVGFYRQGTAAAFKNLRINSFYAEDSSLTSTVSSQSQNMKTVAVDITESLGSNGEIAIYVTNNNGDTWARVSDNTTHTFTTQGSSFRYKVHLRTTSTSSSPYISSVSFDITLGSYDTSDTTHHADSAQYGTDLANQHVHNDPFDYSKLSLKKTLPGEDAVHTSGIIVSPSASQTVLYYVRSSTYELVAYDITAESELWRTTLGSGSYAESTPTYYNGVVYALSYDGLFAINPSNGNILWSYTDPTEGVWGIKIYNNRAYFAQYGSGNTAKIYAVNLTTHTHDWIYSLSTETIGMTPAIDEDTGTLYFSTVQGTLHAIGVNTGTKKWSMGNGTTSWGAITIYGNTLFHATQGKGIRAINKITGEVIWENSTNFGDTTGVGNVSIKNNVVYYGAGNEMMYARDADDGDIVWSYHNNSVSTSMGSNIEITSDGYVYTMQDDGLHVLDADDGTHRFLSTQGGWDAETGVTMGHGYAVFCERITGTPDTYNLRIYEVTEETYTSTGGIETRISRPINTIKVDGEPTTQIAVTDSTLSVNPDGNVTIDFGVNPKIVSKSSNMIINPITDLRITVARPTGSDSLTYDFGVSEIHQIKRDGTVLPESQWSLSGTEVTITDSFSTHTYDIVPMAKDTLQRLEVNQESNHEIKIQTIAGIHTTSDVLTVEFDPVTHAWNLGSITISDIDLEDDGTDKTLGAAPGVNIWGCTINTTTDTITFTAPTNATTDEIAANSIITVKIGTNADSGTNKITNPSTVSSYEIHLRISGNTKEFAEVEIPIIDDDTVNITGYIDTSISFDIDTASTDVDCDAAGGASPCDSHGSASDDVGYVVDLGEMTLTTVNKSGDNVLHADGLTGNINYIWFDLESNANTGTVVTIVSANEELNGPGSNSIPSVATGSEQQIAVLSGLYGLNHRSGFTNSAVSGSLIVHIDCDCTSGDTYYCDVRDSEGSGIPIEVFNSNSNPVDDGRVQWAVGAGPDSDSGTGTYTDQLTFVATSTF